MTAALRRWWQRVLAVVHRRSLDHELQEELSSHLEMAAQDYVDRGMPVAEARRMAAIELGAIGAAREGHREARGLPSLDSLVTDLGHAVRGMRREPGFTLIALTTLALAIGANTVVFSIVNPLLLRPLPFAESDRLMWLTDPAAGGDGLEGPTYRVEVFEAIATHNQAFEELTSYVAFFGRGRFTLTGEGDPQRLSAVPVGPRFFETLGVQPRLGRLFTAEALAVHGPRVAILTDRLWRRQFAGDPLIVGQAMTINNEAMTIVGVLPDTFDFAATFAPGVQVDFFVPAVLDDMRSWGNVLAVVGRLKPGVSQELARADFADLIPRLEDAHPEWRSWVPVVAIPVDLKMHVTGRMRRPLAALWAAVALVLLIACVNLANLLLARTAARGKEIAVRMALGAGRGRVLRQLLTEGFVLSLCGAALGVPLAYRLTMSVRDSAALAMPLLHHVRVDVAALLFTLACASVAGLAIGMVPALRVSGRDLHSVLKERNRGSTDGRSHATLRSALVVAEVALACVLLVGTGLLLRSFLHLLDTDLGFAPSRAFAVRIDTPEGLSDSQRRARLDDMLRSVRVSPGIEFAGLTDALPLEKPRAWGVGVEGQRYQGQDWVTAFVYVTGPGYLPAMGIPLVAGREFAEYDTVDRQPVMMINASLARVLWPGRAIDDAVGQVVKVYGPFKEPVRVIGVVADTNHSGADQAPGTQMYVAHSQVSATADLVVRSPLQPEAVASGLRATLGTADPGIVVTDFRPIEELVERAVSPRRFLVTMVAGFSALALTLASLGIYGVVSYTVSQRGQDIAVRMALGATSGAVSRQVLGGTLRLAMAGIALGLALSAIVARAIASLLFRTSPLDASTFAGTALVLVVVALTAGAIPAMRAARTDPATALRAD